jgi:hypothetical protein
MKSSSDVPKWLVALVLLTACGPGTAQPLASLSPPSAPTAALAAWKDFPADANPRPIIVFERTLEHIGPAGFTTEPDRKLDWGCNKFGLAPGVTLPATAPGSATAAGVSYRALGAVEAYSELIAARGGFASKASQCPTARPFMIKDVRWHVAGFPTDRGTMPMSAWLFDISEIDAYLGYSALEPSAFWGNRVSPEGMAGGHISADGLTLALGTTGGPETPGPCGEDLSASAAESDTAVAVAIARRFHTPPAGEGCTAKGYFRTVMVRLSRPLGGRVLIDAKGDASAVCVDGTAC